MPPPAPARPDAPRPFWSEGRTVLGAALIVLAVQALLLATSNSGVLQGRLFDPDCYMHLARALHLLQSRDWSGFDTRINAPFGYAIHWASLFDALLAAGAVPFTWLGFDLHGALYLWGSVISPLLLIAALAAFAGGVRPFAAGPVFLWLTVLVFTQPEFSGAFLSGRPDHHSLILGFTLAQIGWLYAALDGRAGWRFALAAGVAAGIQLCTTVEALITILFVSLVMGLGWAFYLRPVLRLLALYLAGCFAVTLAWLAFTRTALFLAPAFDRASIVHLVLLAAGLVALLACRLPWPRPVRIALAAAVAMAIMGLIFPDFFLGPWPHLDPAVKAWHRDISELQPTLPTDMHRLAQLLAQFAAAFLALPFALRLLRQGKSGERLAMFASLCGFAVFGGLALFQMRWSGEMQAAMLLPWTLATQALMKSKVALALGPRRLPLRSFALAAALLLQIVPGALAPARALPDARQACDWSEAARGLAAAPPGIIMTELWYGPEIVWRTPLDVVGAPYEIAPALKDSAAFDGTAAAREILARRRIRYVLNCGPRTDATALGLVPRPFAVPGFHFYEVVSARP